MQNKEIQLSDLSTHEKFILRICGDNEQENEKITGLHARRDANYLTSLKVLEYIGDSRYRLTALGKELFLLHSLKFKQKSEIISESSVSELVIN